MGVDLYPPMIMKGDLSPDSFGGEVDEICNEISEACKGFGTNEERLLKAMGSLTPGTRCKVPLRYKELFGKDLKDVMKTECGSKDFGTALQFLAQNPVEAECDMIMSACKGIGTKEKLLGTIICGRSNAEMDLLKKKFFDIHTKDLGRVLDSELGGSFEALVFNCLQAADEKFDPKFHNDDKMKEDAEALYKMGQGSFGTNEKGLFKILVCSPVQYLQKLNLHYADKYGLTLLKALETEMRGATRDSAMFMLKMKLKPYEAIAGLIDEACKGLGTNELLLTCTLIRYQSIMKKVAAAHVELFGSTIEDRIKSETKRDYEKILLEIVAAGH